ncbi:MAG: hypothetical protein E6G48_06030 [Actinobacteria bacterium]|nr:MAG: hypothetical protein E6G48_06030 [Actinomycetota bacterium]
MSACPACGEPLFGWLLVGPDANGNPNDSVLLERCEHCRLGVAADLAPASTPSALLGFARQIPEGRFELRVANRASVQASLGGSHWAALERQRGLYPTPQSLPPLAAAAGLEIEELRCPRRGQGQAWMWQTILNAFTFHENFARDVRAGTLRPGSGRGRLRFGIDAVVTALAALPVALVSAPLELFAALLGRGGELVAVARRTESSL